MLRTTTVAAVRAFKPVQVSAIPRRAYSEDAFKKKETAEEAKYFRAKVNISNQPFQSTCSCFDHLSCFDYHPQEPKY